MRKGPRILMPNIADFKNKLYDILSICTAKATLKLHDLIQEIP